MATKEKARPAPVLEIDAETAAIGCCSTTLGCLAPEVRGRVITHLAAKFIPNYAGMGLHGPGSNLYKAPAPPVLSPEFEEDYD